MPRGDNGGRKPKLSDEKIDRIVGLVKSGVYDETAAASVGVTAQSLRRWIRIGIEERQKTEAGKPPSKDAHVRKCAEIADLLLEARAAAEIGVSRVITEGIMGCPAQYDERGNKTRTEQPPDPRLAADFAARRWPMRFSERARLAAREIIDEDLNRLRLELDEATFERVAEILTRRDS